MSHYETLDTKVNNKIHEIKHLTNYNSTKSVNINSIGTCTSVFSCFTIETFNQRTDLDKISLFLDLVILEAIDQGKQLVALELVLEVNLKKKRSY